MAPFQEVSGYLPRISSHLGDLSGEIGNVFGVFCLFPAQLHKWIEFYKTQVSLYKNTGDHVGLKRSFASHRRIPGVLSDISGAIGDLSGAFGYVSGIRHCGIGKRSRGSRYANPPLDLGAKR